MKTSTTDLDNLLLQAKTGYWDPKLFTLDVPAAITAAHVACSQIEETEWFQVGTDIYMERKKQIAHQLEAALMMPSYTGAKQLHEVMQAWLAFLMELPCLNASLIESEIILCTNLCTRSKMGFMPNDRLVYTAYTTFNNKKSYGDMFKRLLQPRLEQQKSYERHLQEEARAHIGLLLDTASSQHLSSQEKVEQDAYYHTLLERDIAKLVNVTNKNYYQQQINELIEQFEKLKPYKIKQRRTITTRIDVLEKKIHEIDEKLIPLLNPLYQQLAQLQNLDCCNISNEGF